MGFFRKILQFFGFGRGRQQNQPAPAAQNPAMRQMADAQPQPEDAGYYEPVADMQAAQPTMQQMADAQTYPETGYYNPDPAAAIYRQGAEQGYGDGINRGMLDGIALAMEVLEQINPEAYAQMANYYYQRSIDSKDDMSPEIFEQMTSYQRQLDMKAMADAQTYPEAGYYEPETQELEPPDYDPPVPESQSQELEPPDYDPPVPGTAVETVEERVEVSFDELAAETTVSAPVAAPIDPEIGAVQKEAALGK